MAQQKKQIVDEWTPRPFGARRNGRKLIACVVGTRPEAIKMAPVIKALRGQHDYYDVQVILTGQHPQVEAVLADDFDIYSDQNLAVIRAAESLDELMDKTLLGEAERGGHRPDMVLVQGNTTSAFAAAQSAFLRKMSVGHVEAGLRSQDRCDPLPEEMNRRVIGTLADVHFAPTRRARYNLLNEGVRPERVALTGNTVVDALNRMMAVNNRRAFALPAGIPQDGRRLLVATMHRRDSRGAEIGTICGALRRLVDRFEDTRLVVPRHPNPTVAGMVTETLGKHDRIHPIPALPYGPFIRLIAASHLILADSSGIQTEAPSLRVPALVMRDTTERTEATATRQVKLVGRDPDAIFAIASTLLSDPAAYQAMRSGPNPFGDGQAAARIVLAMRRFFEGQPMLLSEEETFDVGRRKIDANDPAFAAEYYRRAMAPEVDDARPSPTSQVEAIKQYLAEYDRSRVA